MKTLLTEIVKQISYWFNALKFFNIKSPLQFAHAVYLYVPLWIDSDCYPDSINRLVFVLCVHCDVRTEPKNVINVD
jgi:hypothetical protein